MHHFKWDRGEKFNKEVKTKHLSSLNLCMAKILIIIYYQKNFRKYLQLFTRQVLYNCLHLLFKELSLLVCIKESMI